MSQADQAVANGSGAVVRADINAQLEALVTNSSGTSAPSVTWPYQWWADTTNGLIKQRNGANTGWVTIGAIDGTNWTPYRQGTALGTAAIKDTGTDTGDVVLLEDVGGAAGLPAVDGSQLTAIPTPTGTVLQEVVATDAGGSTGSTTYATVQVTPTAITPKSDNSTLVIEITFDAQMSLVTGVNAEAFFRIYEDSTHVGSTYLMAAASGTGGISLRAPSVLRAVVSNAALTERSFDLRAQESDGTTVTAAGLIITIREIQG